MCPVEGVNMGKVEAMENNAVRDVTVDSCILPVSQIIIGS